MTGVSEVVEGKPGGEKGLRKRRACVQDRVLGFTTGVSEVHLGFLVPGPHDPGQLMPHRRTGSEEDSAFPLALPESWVRERVPET